METVFKTGTQSDSNPFEFVMSDATVDRLGDIIVPEGWALTSFRKNPIALFGHDSKNPIGRWTNVRVEKGALMGVLELAAEGTSQFIDTLRKLLAQRILKAVSVGFRPLQYEPLDPDSPWDGMKFTKQELLECSLVSVPANPAALSLTKGLSLEERAFLFAKSGLESQDRAARLPPPTTSRKVTLKGPQMGTLADKIKAKQEEIVALKDQVTPLAKKIEDEVDFENDEEAEFDGLTKTLDETEAELAKLRKAEKALAGSARPLQEVRGSTAAAPVSPAIVDRRVMGSGRRKDERPADLLVKMMVCHFQSHVTRKSLENVKEERYRDRDDVDAVVKAVTNPAMSTVAGWAAELVETAIDDYISSLNPSSVYAALRGRGSSFTFGRSGAIKIPRRTGSGTSAPGDLRGAFVGEGAPIPVRRANFAAVTLTPHKMGVISTFTREMAAHSTPAIENLIREGMNEDTAIAIDTALLDNLPATAVRPAGLMNGVTPIAGAAGADQDAVTADFSALLAPFITANAATGIVVLINPSELLRLSMLTNALGQYIFRDQINAGNILGLSFVTSTSVPAKTLIALRLTDFATATGDTPEFDVSDVATLHEEDGTYAADQTVTQPASTVKPIGTTGTPAVVAAPVRSLWQTATIGIRMLLDMDWVMRRPAMVQAVSNVTW